MAKADPTTARVIFMPSGKRGTFELGTPILTCARSLGVDIDSVCGGRGICGRCQIEVGSGEFAKHGISSKADRLAPVTKPEQRYGELRDLREGRRLSCQAKLTGDVLIDVPVSSQMHRQIVRKRADARAIEVDPVVRLHYVRVEQPDMDMPKGDYERLAEALKEQWQIDVDGIDTDAMHGLQDALRKDSWHVTVAVLDGVRIIRVWPGFHDRACGLAIDVGSTTIAIHLCDLQSGDVLATSGMMNPQIRFGEDLMSRVSYAMMNERGAGELTDAIRTGLNEAIGEAIVAAGVEAGDVVSLSIVGNPVMHHMLLGLDSIPLGTAPFALAIGSALTRRASELDLDCLHADASVYFLPCIAGHVGADAAAMVLSEGPHLRDEITLLIDVGTNAEIVLGNRHRLLAASSPTGPAFEGAQISSGQRAAPGAIERVRIDAETLEPRFKVIGCELWSDESGFAEEITDIGVTGICGSGIIEVLAQMYLAGLMTTDGVIDGSRAAQSKRVVAQERTFGYLLHDGDIKICITQTDVRAIQLAKAALYAGAQLLMDKFGITTVDRIVLAGAFGSYIDARYAMVLGMIPDCDIGAVSSAGNAAGTGARIALVNKKARSEIEALVNTIEKIETAVEPRFQEHFISAMAIPHKTAEFPYLRKVVDLPEVSNTGQGDSEGGGRRRRRSRRPRG